MKKHRLMMLMFASAALLFASCGKEAENSQSYDPPGTVYVHIQNDYKTKVKLWPDTEKDAPKLCIDDANNFISSSYYTSGGRSWYTINFCDVGDVRGLGDIGVNSYSGRTDRAAVIPGHGYIADCVDGYNSGLLARLYVVDYIKNALGEIIGAEVKYQSPWEWEPENI